LSIDVKGEGGYVIAPPSKHPDGKLYKLRNPKNRLRGIADVKKLPDDKAFDFRAWLYDALDGVEGFKAKEHREEHTVEKYLNGVEQGGRNDTAIVVASFFRVKKNFDKEKAWKQLQLWNNRNKPPLGEDELKRVLNSAYDGDPYKYRFKGGVETELFDVETEEKAEELLKRDNIFEYLEKDALKDIIGYREQKITLFLLNLMRESVHVLGDTSTGKSHMCDRVFKCFPKKSYFKITGVTDKAIRYLAESIRHLYLAEWQAIGGKRGEESTAAFDVKLVISEGKLTILVVERDEETGKFQTRKITTSVENIISTTTKVDLPPELLNRIWEVTTDKALTPEVVKFKIQQAMLPPNERVTCKNERRVLRCAIERIEREAPNKFVIPFFGMVATKIFEKLWNEPRASRDVDKLEKLIWASAYLHYKNRPIIETDEATYIVCLPEDFYYATLYGKDVIIGTFTGETKRYKQIKDVVEEIGEEGKEITAETLAAVTGLTRNSAQAWLRKMRNNKVIFLKKKKKGKGGPRIFVWAEKKGKEIVVDFDTEELYPLVEDYLKQRKSGSVKHELKKAEAKKFEMRFRFPLLRRIEELPDAEEDDDDEDEKEKKIKLEKMFH